MVQRVFNLLLILLTIYSCSTIKNEAIVNKIEINVKSKKNNPSVPIIDSLPKTTKIKNLSTITDGSISTLKIIGSDLWIGKLGGELIRYNLYTDEYDKFLTDNYSIKDFSIKKIVDYGDFVIILQSDRVIVFTKADESIRSVIFPVEIARATDIIVYKNRVYISTLGYGLWEYNIYTSEFMDFIPFIKYISSLYLDENKLYIGTMDSGLYCYDLINKKLESRLNYPLALFNKNIVVIDKDNTTLWLGTFKNGLIKWDLNKNEAIKLLNNESITSLNLETNFKLASLMGSGIYIEYPNSSRIESIDSYLITNNVTSIVIFNNRLISGNIKKGVISQELKIE